MDEGIVLPEPAIAKLVALRPVRTILPDNPLSQYQDATYLWLNDTRLRHVFEAVLRDSIGAASWEWREAKNGKEYVHLEDENVSLFMEQWKKLAGAVVIRDLTALTVAMAMTRPRPDAPRTAIGELLYQAKYMFSVEAARNLAELAADTAEAVPLFHRAKHIVPVPSSKRDKGNLIPALIAHAISKRLKVPYSPHLLMTVRDRPAVKVVNKAEKPLVMQGTLAVGQTAKDDSILLVDDHYQSGTSINYATLALRHRNATATVYAFAVDKTLRNTDNVST